MWILLAALSALFAGATSILAKIGIRRTDSTVATAIRTAVVLVMSWCMVLVVGSQGQLRGLSGKNLLFLVLSGLATGASWLCYFRALKLGNVNRVVAVDKSSTILTILLAFLLLGEPFSPLAGAAMALMALGTWLMLEKKADQRHGEGPWLLYAAGSAVFASLTSILAKLGISGVESNLGPAVRTSVVLVMAWAMVALTGKWGQVRQIEKRELLFICLSGLATGGSWLCYYRALQAGPASVVVPIDKLSILVVALFARVFLGERLSRRAGAGLALLTAGTLLMVMA